MYSNTCQTEFKSCIYHYAAMANYKIQLINIADSLSYRLSSELINKQVIVDE